MLAMLNEITLFDWGLIAICVALIVHSIESET